MMAHLHMPFNDMAGCEWNGKLVLGTSHDSEVAFCM